MYIQKNIYFVLPFVIGGLAIFFYVLTTQRLSTVQTSSNTRASEPTPICKNGYIACNSGCCKKISSPYCTYEGKRVYSVNYLPTNNLRTGSVIYAFDSDEVWKDGKRVSMNFCILKATFHGPEVTDPIDLRSSSFSFEGTGYKCPSKKFDSMGLFNLGDGEFTDRLHAFELSGKLSGVAIKDEINCPKY